MIQAVIAPVCAHAPKPAIQKLMPTLQIKMSSTLVLLSHLTKHQDIQILTAKEKYFLWKKKKP